MAALLEAMIDEGLNSSSGASFPANPLVEAQIGTDHDHGTAGHNRRALPSRFAEAALLCP